MKTIISLLLICGWFVLLYSSFLTDIEGVTFINEMTGAYGRKIQSTLKIKGSQWQYDIPAEQASVIVTNEHQYAVVNYQTKLISYANVKQSGRRSLDGKAILDEKTLDEAKKGLQLTFSGRKQKILG